MKDRIITGWLCAILAMAGTAGAQITPQEAVSLMEKGINLGNTLEPPDEGGWNNPPAREGYFDLYKEAGFDVVRIPVRWDGHTSYDAPYRVDPDWMDRVEEVVDWGLERDLFIVVNAHHEDWIKENYSNPAYRDRFDSIWSQIAVRFRDKPEKLLFEIINEPYGLTKAQNDELHQRVLSIIRKSNPARNVIIQGHNWGGSDELIEMSVPEDDYLIGSFHSYDPWPFGLTGEGPFGYTELVALRNKFQAVQEWSFSTGIPVFLGEFGCHRDADYNLRMKHYRTYVEFSREFGFTPCAWDDGGNFRIMERASSSWNEIKDILIRTTAGAPADLQISLHQDTMVRLGWTNRVDDPDSIIIERKISQTSFSRIAALTPDSSVYIDPVPARNTYYYYRIIAQYAGDSGLYSQPVRIFMPVYVPRERGFFMGEPLAIPGVIEAEYFDLGGEGIAYHDEDALNLAGAFRPDEGVDIYDRLGEGYHIGNMLPGEWLEYTVRVDAEGEYLVDVHLAALQDGGSFVVRVGDSTSDTLESKRSGSWLTTTKVSFRMPLEAGEQILRFTVIDQPAFNFDKMEFSPVTSAGGSLPGMTDRNPSAGISVTEDGKGCLLIRHHGATSASVIRVHDLTGSVVAMTIIQPEEQTRMAIPGLAPGIYVISAVSGQRMDCVKTMVTSR